MITILTIDSYNQGNRLQNYALSETLKNLSDEKVRTARIRDFGGVRNALWFPLSKAKASIKAMRSASDKRAVRFLDFTHRRIPTIQITPKQLIENDDIVVVGSDQCWNPDWGLGARADGLQCVVGKASVKKLSYAASFGVSENHFTQEQKERYGSWLKSLNSISVREKEAVKIVRDFSGRDAQLVLDPTMLLTATEWLSLERKPKGFPYADDAFCLEYVLGKSDANGSAHGYAERAGVPVYTLTNLTPEVGPEEFIWLIHHSHAVFTDSFHGSVFSLIFHKRLLVLKRNDHLADMSSRFETLSQFSVFDSCVSDNNDSCFVMEHDQHDWDVYDAELAALRSDSIDWLRNALSKCQ